MVRRSIALFVLCLLAFAVLLVSGARQARGQAVAATYVDIGLPPGWNLVSFIPPRGTFMENFRVFPTQEVYTLAPGDTRYTVLPFGTPRAAGAGYWVFTPGAVVPEYYGLQGSVNLTLAAGRCALIGNPFITASARVTGASRVLVYSPILGNYVPESLLGIGRGAWACNDTDSDEAVTISDHDDVPSVDWPSCCSPAAFGGGGKAEIVLFNDSPFPLITVMSQIDVEGNPPPVTGDGYFGSHATACSACPESDPQALSGCNPAAEARHYTLPPGRWQLHMQSEGTNVPDLIGTVAVDANTSYHLCYSVDANRPQKGLP